MVNLFGEPYSELPKRRKPIDKQRRAWENAFQRWCERESMDETTATGICGFGKICNYCENNDKGRPCVRALNAMCREKRIKIDYTDRNFERWF